MGARQAGSSEDRILLGWNGFLPIFSLPLLSFLLNSDLFSSRQRVSIDHATRHPFAAFRSLGGGKIPFTGYDFRRRLSLGQPTRLETE